MERKENPTYIMSDYSSTDGENLLYPNKNDTLTSRNIVDAYRSAYYSVHQQQPTECTHIQGRWFLVNGVERDRGWILLEVERLRQEAIAHVVEENATSGSRGRILQMIRRLSRI
jgi:hypothetical protein